VGSEKLVGETSPEHSLTTGRASILNGHSRRLHQMTRAAVLADASGKEKGQPCGWPGENRMSEA
jgi:hypothetical protein